LLLILGTFPEKISLQLTSSASVLSDPLSAAAILFASLINQPIEFLGIEVAVLTRMKRGFAQSFFQL
jgi:hypothetical protein